MDLDAKALGRRVEEPKQAAWCTVVDIKRRPSFSGPRHSDNRMTLAIYTLAAEGMQVSATTALEETFSGSGC